MKKLKILACLLVLFSAVLISGCGEKEDEEGTVNESTEDSREANESATALPVKKIDFASLDIPYTGGEYQEEGLFMAVLPCPEEHMAYAPEAVARYLYAYSCEMGVDYFADESVQVGNPFTFANANSDIFYFPILRNGEIFYIVRIYQDADGGCSAAASTMLAEELNLLSEKTNSETPLFLVSEADGVSNFVAYIGKEKSIIYSGGPYSEEETWIDPAKLVTVCVTQPCSDFDLQTFYAAIEEYSQMP